MTLTVEHASRLLADIVYRPNGDEPAEFSLAFNEHIERWYVEMKVSVRDSRDIGTRTLIPVSALADMRDEESFVRGVLQLACWFAAHEACEWFRFEDTLIADPHQMASPELRVRRVNLPAKPGR